MKAAKQNMGLAHNNIGVMYSKGRGIKKDYAQAYYWLHSAALQNIVTAKELLESLTQKMTPGQIALAKKNIEK